MRMIKARSRTSAIRRITIWTLHVMGGIGGQVSNKDVFTRREYVLKILISTPDENVLMILFS
jgi:hypothetical protein